MRTGKIKVSNNFDLEITKMSLFNTTHEGLQAHYTENLVEAGLDEAGRGCLAGAVVAAAVILPRGYQHKLLRDSKQLNKQQRESLRTEIMQEALAYAIAEVSATEIDEINIRNASVLAMHRAVAKLSLQPEILLVDGNFFLPYQHLRHVCIVKGDDKILSIAAASILAKTYRDDLMTKYAEQYPMYHWEKNAAYPTKAHYAAIKEFGITPLHRKSFKLEK